MTKLHTRSLRIAAAAACLCASLISQARAVEDEIWPSEGARSPQALCAWFRAHDVGEAVPATCRVVCRASRGRVQAAVLHRASGFHAGLAIAIRDGGKYRVVHDDVDDEDGVIIQGGMWGRVNVPGCSLRLEGSAPVLTVDVTREQSGEPPNVCNVTRDAQRVTCTRTDDRYACTRAVTTAPITERDTSEECAP